MCIMSVNDIGWQMVVPERETHGMGKRVSDTGQEKAGFDRPPAESELMGGFMWVVPAMT